MKKTISILLIALTLISLLSLCSCYRSEADIDIRRQNNVYSNLYSFINNPQEYKGKTVALKSTYMAVYDFSKNKVIRHTLSETDTTGEKRALYEIRYESGEYPQTGSRVTIFGTIADNGYIQVERFENAEASQGFDIDTLDLDADELKALVTDYRAQYEQSENYGKTVRIFGHLKTVDEGYTYLLGLDSNGAYIWDIELYDPDGRFDYPTAEGNTVNPVEVIGELSTYTEENVVYACIKVKQVGRVESVFQE